MMPNRVAVLGVTGTVGSRVAERLASRTKVRGVCRDPSRFLGPPGIDLLQADLTNPHDAENAIEGVRAVYLTPPEEGNDPLTDELTVVTNVVNACRRHNVRHLVLHTFLQAKQGDTGARMIDNKTEVERIVKQSGVPFTILRPGWFLENLRVARPMMERGRLELPLPQQHAFATVSADDIAKAAVGFLEKGAQNRGFDMHLEGGTRCEDLCRAAEKVEGRPVEFQQADVEEFLKAVDATEEQKELYGELFRHIGGKEFLGNPQDVRRALPDFTYTSPAEFLRRQVLMPYPTAAPRPLDGEREPPGGPSPPRPRRRRDDLAAA